MLFIGILKEHQNHGVPVVASRLVFETCGHSFSGCVELVVTVFIKFYAKDSLIFNVKICSL